MLSADEKNIYYGIVAGPNHNNFNRCRPESYVASFEYKYQKLDGNYVFDVYDLYLETNENETPTVLWRKDSEWEGSYESCRLDVLLYPSQDPKRRQILTVLLAEGVFSWQKKS